MTNFILMIALLFLYFLPAYIAADKKNRLGIQLLNLLLGWTLLGWVGSLIWAVCSPVDENLRKNYPTRFFKVNENGEDEEISKEEFHS